MFEAKEVYAPTVDQIESMPIFQAFKEYEKIGTSSPIGAATIPMKTGGYEIRKASGGYPYYINPTSSTIRYGGLKPGAINVGLDLTTLGGWEDAIARCFAYEFCHDRGLSAPVAMRVLKGEAKAWKTIYKKMGMGDNFLNDVRDQIAKRFEQSRYTLESKQDAVVNVFSRWKEDARKLQVAWNALQPEIDLPPITDAIAKINPSEKAYPMLCCLELGILDPQGILERF